MPTNNADARFLGLDYRGLWRDICQAWTHLQGVPPLAWLTPMAPVLLLQADGRESLWRGGERREALGKAATARFTALELPEDMVLRRLLSLPAVSDADAASAIELQARAVSPFAAQDLVWGYRAQPLAEGGNRVDMALVSRKQVAQYMQAQATRLRVAAQPEIWITQPAAAPIVLQGYGETLRKRHEVRWRRVGYGLIVLAGALIAAIAVTPTLQLRARAIEASVAHEALARRAAPLVKERETLMQSAEKLGALNEMLAGRIEPLRILDRLTQVLPDDTALQSFSLKGQKVTLMGLTANASALMRVLGEQTGVRDVRAPSPATRLGGEASKENFVIEFTLDPQAFGVVAATGAPAAPTAAPPASTAAASPPQSATAAAPGNANAASAPAPTHAVPAPQGAAPGPLPVFGGGAPAQPASAPARATPPAKGTP